MCMLAVVPHDELSDLLTQILLGVDLRIRLGAIFLQDQRLEFPVDGYPCLFAELADHSWCCRHGASFRRGAAAGG